MIVGLKELHPLHINT